MESEVCAYFETARDAYHVRTTCAEMGHPQPATPIFVNNTAAVGFATGSTKIKRAKAIDMCYHWLTDRAKQGQFRILWTPGSNQYADFITKHHSPGHHFSMHQKFFTAEHLANILMSLLLKGCSSART